MKRLTEDSFVTHQVFILVISIILNLMPHKCGAHTNTHPMFLFLSTPLSVSSESWSPFHCVAMRVKMEIISYSPFRRVLKLFFWLSAQAIRQSGKIKSGKVPELILSLQKWMKNHSAQSRLLSLTSWKTNITKIKHYMYNVGWRTTIPNIKPEEVRSEEI